MTCKKLMLAAPFSSSLFLKRKNNVVTVHECILSKDMFE